MESKFVPSSHSVNKLKRKMTTQGDSTSDNELCAKSRATISTGL